MTRLQHVAADNANEVSFLASSILAGAQAELQALGLDAKAAPAITKALAVLGIAIEEADRLITIKSGRKPT